MNHPVGYLHIEDQEEYEAQQKKAQQKKIRDSKRVSFLSDETNRKLDYCDRSRALSDNPFG